MSRKTATMRSACAASTIRRPVWAAPSYPTWDTFTARSCSAPTGHPARHDEPSCAVVTGSIDDWNAGSGATVGGGAVVTDGAVPGVEPGGPVVVGVVCEASGREVDGVEVVVEVSAGSAIEVVEDDVTVVVVVSAVAD